MKAVCWMGTEKMSVETVPDPKILNPRDAIVRITSTCICGSDLHLYNGFMRRWSRATLPGMSSWARLWKWARAWTKEVASGRPGGGAVHDCLRELFFLPETTLVALRQH